MEIDPKTGKYKLSHRVLEPKPEGYWSARVVRVASVVSAEAVPVVATTTK